MTAYNKLGAILLVPSDVGTACSPSPFTIVDSSVFPQDRQVLLFPTFMK